MPVPNNSRFTLLIALLVSFAAGVAAYIVTLIDSNLVLVGFFVLVTGSVGVAYLANAGQLTYALLLAIPILGSMNADLPLSSVPGSGITDISLLVVDLPLVLGFLMALARLQRKTVKFDPKVRQFLLLFVYFLVWGLFSASFATSTRAGVGRLLIYIRGFLLVVTLLALVTDMKSLRFLLWGFGGIVLLHGTFGILQWINGGPLDVPYLTQLGQLTIEKTNYVDFLEIRDSSVDIVGIELSGLYISGLAGTAYRLAFILNMFVPLWLSIVFAGGEFGRRLHRFSIIALGVSVFLVALSLSRGAWVAMLLGVPFSIFLISRRKNIFDNSQRFYRFMLVLFGSIIGVFLLDVISLRLTQAELITTASIRLNLLVESVQVYLQSPIWGVGIGNYGVQDGVNSYQIVHNFLMIIVAEMGLLGSISFMLMLAISFQISYLLTADSSVNTFVWLIAVGVSAGLIATLTHSLFDWIVFKTNTSLMFWLMIGTLLIVYQNNHFSKEGQTIPQI